LTQDLLNGYDSSILPVINNNQSIKINIDFTLFQLISLDDQKQTITLSAWINLVNYNDYAKNEF
jgi:hypothetical protein